MRTVIAGVALVFIALLAFLTLFVMFTHGPDVLSVLSRSSSWRCSSSGSSARSRRSAERRACRTTSSRADGGAGGGGGRRSLAVLVLLGAGVAAGLTLAPDHARQAARAPATPTVEAPLSDSGPAPLAGGGTAPSPLSVRLDDPRDLVAPALQAPAALGAAVRPRHRPGAVAARPDARAADRLADEDDDRAAGRRARAAGREGADHQGGAAPTRARASACCRSGKWIGVEHDALRAAAAVRQRRGDRARPARRRRHGPALRGDDERARRRRWASSCTRFTSPDGFVDRGNHSCAARPRGARPRGAAPAAARAHRAQRQARAAVPDQGRQDLPLQPQPAAAAGLPRHDRRQDRLHGRRRPLPGGDRPARPRCGSASCCCTRPTRASRRASCSTAASGWTRPDGYARSGVDRSPQPRRLPRAGAAVAVGVLLAARGADRGARDGRRRRTQPATRTAAKPARAEAAPSCRAAGARLLPDRRVVAYYGAPQDAELGALGIGTPAQRGARLERQARPYARKARPVLPALELIAVIAAGEPGRRRALQPRQPTPSIIDRYLTRRAQGARRCSCSTSSPGARTSSPRRRGCARGSRARRRPRARPRVADGRRARSPAR